MFTVTPSVAAMVRRAGMRWKEDNAGRRWEEDNPPRRRFVLQKESELRVEVGWELEPSLRMQLLSGTAESFGTELPLAVWMTFPPAHKGFAIFTWTGCTVELDGIPNVAYVSDQTPMVSYLNAHKVLESRRENARDAMPSVAQGHESVGQGPRVIVVGPKDSGKSSLTRMLLGWAARSGWKPTYIDLDVGQSITIPGTIVATRTPLETPIDPIEGVLLHAPLVYFYGHVMSGWNPLLYQSLVRKLALDLENLFAANADIRAAGMVINTMGWVHGVGYELLLDAINNFKADVVLVLGQEELYSRLMRDVLKGRPDVDIVKLDQSGGVVNRVHNYRARIRAHKRREYFYGLNGDLSTHTFVSDFSDLQVFKICGRGYGSALPVGAEALADSRRLVRVSISLDLKGQMLAVSYAKDPNHLLASNIACFIHIKYVDIRGSRIRFKTPCPGPLPSNLLLAGLIYG